jgi:protein-disulfide isomerase
VGFFYFAGGFLFLLLSINSQMQTLSILSWLNLLALPYTVFSILYQWHIAKQWCPLCLSVQVILIFEFVAGYFGYWSSSRTFTVPSGETVAFLTSFLLPIFFWTATKKKYLDAQNSKTYKKELSKLKYNKEIFNALLSQQKQITIPPDGLGITLGNPYASNTIIKICNPYCGPCAKAHLVIDEILEHNDDLKVQIIFTATDDENDIKAKPVKHLMALYEKQNNSLIRKALDDWYGADKKNYEFFAAQYLLNRELHTQGNKLETMSKWCKETSVSFTPTFFVNGYQLPEPYKIDDLKYLL